MNNSLGPEAILQVSVVSEDGATQALVARMLQDLGHTVQRGQSVTFESHSAVHEADVILFDARFILSGSFRRHPCLLPFVIAPLSPAQEVMLQETTLEPPVSLGGKEPVQALRQALRVVSARQKMNRLSMPPGLRSSKARLKTAPGPLDRHDQRPQRSGLRYELVVIGISTGGPDALAAMLPDISPVLSVPVLIVQHMPAHFTRSLALKLDRLCPLAVAEAEEGEKLLPGRILIAPGAKHLELLQKPGARVVSLSDKPAVNGCRPSVDVLLNSIAGAGRGRGTLVCMMTGMGADGLAGCRQIHAQGGSVLTQSKETCTVYGMPRVVEQAGLAAESVDLSNMASRINARVEEC